MDLVDEENLAQLNVAQNPDQIQLLLQNRPGALRESGFQFLSDDLRQRSLPQPRRTVEQNVIHGLAAPLGRFDGNLQVFLDVRLAREVV